jgi:hypothetical protein
MKSEVKPDRRLLKIPFCEKKTDMEEEEEEGRKLVRKKMELHASFGRG